ncbi:DUF4269 domain-containing protein [Rhizobiaceae bacterium n13]|uniref:DUF4269 domain-containing protein n=1 Tax=Ferirhizobium litorale TaxID=2927786 RepID=A0AAE3QG45_9HYPH|nr:DUF4269 domain-containing protein [Fererhizobium litorale]MDI7865133.1 DUF4269 domain-containing protein [Fererhizobium litorale]MDI7922895.1 DUF4269 domain-containing protein [Fererhizobium litorale]
MSRITYIEAIEATGILRQLADFDPHVAGTLPLDVHTGTSDIDILCHAPDDERFSELLWSCFGGEGDFRMWQWSGSGRPVLASFRAHGWEFEIFGAGVPVAEQSGWRHFEVERRLLALGGPAFRDAVMALRGKGVKTESAFWAALGQTGDPYQGMLGLYHRTDDELVGVLAPLWRGSLPRARR